MWIWEASWQHLSESIGQRPRHSSRLCRRCIRTRRMRNGILPRCSRVSSQSHQQAPGGGRGLDGAGISGGLVPRVVSAPCHSK
eukprot:2998401-Amphidinium_carterae.1